MGSKKFIAVLGGLIGIAAVILGLFIPSFGWWEVLFDPILGNNVSSYLSAFGYTTNTANENIEFLGYMFLIGGIVFLIGSFLVIIGGIKESKALAVLSSLIMIGGLIVFCIALGTNEDFENILEGLNFLFGEEYNVFFGEASGILLLGTWTWRLGNGFFIGIVAVIIALIGSFLVD